MEGLTPDALLHYGAVVAAGIVAGFVNTLAGGGSLLTLPALMLLGLPADVANGTNRLAVVTQSASGVIGFHREGKLDTGAIAGVVAPTVVGAAVGAGAAAAAPNWLLEPALLGTMVLMALVMAVRPDLVMASEGEAAQTGRLASTAGLFAAGVYGGFIQAGVGFVLLAVLGGLLRYDAVRANALKLVCTLTFGVVALGIFVAAGDVAWIPAAVLAVATVVGSQLGVRFAVRVDPKVLRWILLVAVTAACVAAFLKARGILS